MAKFDWWQGTIHAGSPDHTLAELSARVELSDVVPDRAMHGYHRGAKVVRGTDVIARVWWGGNPGVHVQLTGSAAAAHGDWLRKHGAQPTRVDVAEDWVIPGLADELFRSAQAFALKRGIRVQHQGDWTRGEGRTLYLGSRQSTAQLVIYEKGDQLGTEPDWVRLEVRLYPKRNREQVAQLSAGECLGVCPWIRDYLASLGWDHLETLAIGTVWTPTDAERAKAAVCRQYGKILASWASEVGGWEALGVVLGEAIESQNAPQGHRREPA